MALGKRGGSGLELGSGVVQYTRSLSGKRIAISSQMEDDFPAEMKIYTNEKLNNSPQKGLLEALPHDILVRILCGVDHDDLKQLFHVSKLIREATIVAKKWHFEFSTPTKSTFSMRNFNDVAPSDDVEEIEAPNAPIISRTHKSQLSKKKLISISKALFT